MGEEEGQVGEEEEEEEEEEKEDDEDEGGRGRSDLVSSNSSLMWDQEEGKGGRPCTLWQANK